MNKDIKWLFIDKKSKFYEETIDLVYEELFKDYNYSKETILAEKQNNGIHIIAIYDSKVVGHARLFVENNIGMISQVAVKNGYRNLKIGSGVIKNLVKEAEKLELEFVELNSREDAIEFYEKLGFFRNGELKKSVKTGLPLLNMRKYVKSNMKEINLNWSLDEIYKSFDDEEFKNDINKLDECIKDINSWGASILKRKDSHVKKLEEYIEKRSDFEELSNKLEIFINLSLSVNTKDKEALRYSDIIEKKLTEVVETFAKVEKWISSIDSLDCIIEKSNILKEYKFLFGEIVEKGKYILSEKEENIISNMKNTGSSAWEKLKDNLVSNLMVEINGKEEPLTVVLNMVYDKDENVRKSAYEAEIKSYKKIEEGVAAALNGIKGEVLTISNIRGYKSPLHMTLLHSRMDEESLNAMLFAMEESLPVFRKYLRKKAELLGHKNGLPFYDLYAPIVDCDMKFSYEEAGDFVEKNFRSFSESLGNYARKAIDNRWIDVMPKEGKVGGAFCENIHSIGESRFLLNFGGSFSDVVTLAHELGHGFHGECLKNEKILNFDYPMPIAETASTFCETIIKNAAIKNASKKEALAILETEICDDTQVIVDIYSRFLFEKNLFEKRKESALSVEEIKNLMIDAQKEAYGDGLDPNFLHPYMWLWKPHYYDADYNFYNYPYAFGLLFSKGLYAEYLKRGDYFVKDYEKLLSITGKNKLEDVAKVMGIDIHNVEFWRNSLKLIEDNIEKFIEISKN